MAQRRFLSLLALFAACGFALRVVYGLSLDDPSGDAAFYHQLANRIADGEGFVNPFLGSPTAAHPPLFPALLSLVSLAGATSLEAHQVAGCAFGAGTVFVIGLGGRRLAGPTAGLGAAALAALYLPLIANDSLLFSESLYGLAIALVIVAALWALDGPSPMRAGVLGVAIGAAALVRTEALGLVVLLGVPLALRRTGLGWRGLAVLCAGAAVVILPWTARNWITFDRPVLVSTNDGSVIAGANCPSTYGPLLGQWDLGCAIRAGIDPGSPGDRARALDEKRALEAVIRGRPVPATVAARLRRTPRNEAEVAARQRDAGFAFAREHPGDLPKVLAARTGRTWSFYRPGQQVRLNRFLRGSPAWLEWLTLVAYAVALVLAVVGGVRLRQRGGPLFVVLAPVVLVLFTSLVGYGTPRFRDAADVSIVLLAGVALGTVRRPWT